ncbi:MAG: hypothetical protein Q9195_003483 [Heterodermia aff. obscurata]
MVSPNTRARLLQEAHDHQEREGNAAAEIAEKREKMKAFEEQVQEQDAILRQLDVKDAAVLRELSYLDSEERRLRAPLPIGSERQGGGALQHERERQLRAIAKRRAELLQSREAAQEERRTAQAAREEAQGELNVLSGSMYAPEREVLESQREIQRIFNELAPPPPLAPAASTIDPQDDVNGTVSKEPDEERDNEDDRQ